MKQSKKKIIEKYELIKSNSFSKIIYIPFEGIPILGNKLLNNAISNFIREKIIDLDGKFINYLDLSINNFLISGCPFQTSQLSKIAFDIFSLDFKKNEPKKLLITDIDNTFWSGILGENGLEEINADQNGRGYPHFIYQTLLKRLNNNGILICALSKNDSKDIEEAFKLNKFIFGYEDFVSIIATYEPKSLQIKQLLKLLNLTEDSFIFIDDNDVEINEVSKLFNQKCCIKFPSKLEDFSDFLSLLISKFSIQTISYEDVNRKELYQKRLKGIEAKKGKSQDITQYLIDLDMEIKIKHPKNEEMKRSIQLINKTNQFNMNGIRFTENEIISIINKGGYLITGELHDRYGSHGEIISLLIDKSGFILSYVMSCRVFQREIEFIFLKSLKSLPILKFKFNYLKTLKNEPFEKFMNILKLQKDDGYFIISADDILRVTKSREHIFNIS